MSEIPTMDELMRRNQEVELDNIALRTDVERLTAQLPDGMKHCAIRLKECAKGHGWLTADNWVQHECQACAIERLTRERDELRSTALVLADTVKLLRQDMFKWREKVRGLAADCRVKAVTVAHHGAMMAGGVYSWAADQLDEMRATVSGHD